MTIAYQTVKEYNQAGHPRRDEILYHFNFHINYREGQPKALRIKEVTTTRVTFELDNGKELYQEWF